jgi:hypothetical protein
MNAKEMEMREGALVGISVMRLSQALAIAFIASRHVKRSPLQVALLEAH